VRGSRRGPRRSAHPRPQRSSGRKRHHQQAEGDHDHPDDQTSAPMKLIFDVVTSFA
jgi:hypothetical protein